ncbi:LOW QUALITY PROTEIN: taste receptor type 2 member 14-like [Alexandromys fortis]|uniref:LOW QUALITY PROTEIN: taste receptor type 2 member 14-like n=1 Tax=Alexandromys fortis TaxID=100897 RepID=UPI002152739A|nr:LOW QUALITY PROTEIN: taste receptor type 2 member 14-like [Microtus fortis]
MATILQNILAIIFLVEFFIGNLGNGFIAMVNCADSVKRRKIPSVDQILTALAISRFSLLWVIFLDWLVWIKFSPSFLTRNILRITQISWNISNHFSIWLATSLSIFYFLKIAPFSNSLFLYLKWKIKRVVLIALLLSLVLLFLNIFLVIKHIDAWIDGYKINTSNSLSSSFVEYPRLILLPSLMFTLIPFGVSLTVFLLLIISLWKHIKKKMQHYTKGCRDVRTLAHITALQNLVVFLLFYITFFLSLVVELWTFDMEKELTLLFVRVTLTIFPSIHSYVFILGHSKLRQDLFSVLQWLKYWCKHV